MLVQYLFLLSTVRSITHDWLKKQLSKSLIFFEDGKSGEWPFFKFVTCDSFLSTVLSIYPNIAAEKFEKLTKDTMVVMIKN